ncbi:hypothetical protein IOE58_13980 [Brachybacterium sp. Marseille-Q2903]|uniref:Uncharacterized protein n=1 Tax=Brachybacterium epidermidis TaxID=2781983 RepID=A0ABR9W450_9MICO|nr:hypothetical protein [Brachybacterium epidermidis]MBE9405229.1 hypothetical protein [Brachybacterium epidermidis]
MAAGWGSGRRGTPNGPRPRTAQQATSATPDDGPTAHERAIDQALNRPAPTADDDDLADLAPNDQALMRAWRDASPADLDDDEEHDTERPSPTRGLSPADAQLYRRAWGGR